MASASSVSSITSRDSTRIGFLRKGAGPPLVLVHGISSDADRWDFVLSALAEHFTVYAMDRRGRGRSGDRADYTIEREFEDVATLVDEIAPAEGPLFLFGHSYGGLCALHAMLRTSRVTKLVVYEPYAPVVAAPEPSAITKRYEAMAERGEREEVLSTFLREIVLLSEAEVAKMRAHSSWAARIASAHTIPREMRGAEQFRFDPSAFAGRMTPIDMLVGEKSPAFLQDATQRLHEALPTSRVVVLPGQRHVAMNSAPSLFVRTLRESLLG